ncbi:MAG: hypothetical protein ABGY41_19495 [Candidatus Poribacteria bacterium]
MAIVIGYGTKLRGDRAAGRAVAEAVSQRAAPGVWTYSVDRLTRAHAEEMTDEDLVVFVGTYDAGPADPVRVTRVADLSPRGAAHYVDSPESLLSLFRSRHGRRPDAWSVLLPATHTDVDEALSPAAKGKVVEATDTVLGLVHASAVAAPPPRRTVRELLGIG